MADWIKLQAGELTVELAPAAGGSIARFRLGQQDLMRPAPAGSSDALEMASFPLVPFSNRVRDGRFTCDGKEVRLTPNLPGDESPMHGQGWRAPWIVDEAGPRSAVLSFVHEPGEWPWRYEARQSFQLTETELTLVLSCRNLSADRMPCALGAHPYFLCDNATRLDTQVGGVWTIDEKVLPVELVPATGQFDPTGQVCGRGLDHGYEGWSGEAVISWGSGAGLRITANAPRFQLYSPANGGMFVAEPVENANAALNKPQAEWHRNGILFLEANEEHSLEVRFETLT